MKLEAKDLRIGNLVFFDNDYYTVSRIEDDKITGIRRKDIGNEVVGLLQVKPLKLTEKWLKKLGFRLETFPLDTNSSKPCYFKPEGYVKISTTDTNDMFWFSYNYTNRKIKYVHQLQNLYFALTNEELTIKN